MIPGTGFLPEQEPYRVLQGLTREVVEAYQTLRSRRQQAEPMVDETKQLHEAAHHFLHQMGLAHILGAPIEQFGSGESGPEWAQDTARAYAAAQAAWIDFVAGLVGLGHEWARRGDLERAEAIADRLDAWHVQKEARELRCAVAFARAESALQGRRWEDARAQLKPCSAEEEQSVIAIGLIRRSYTGQARDAVAQGNWREAEAAARSLLVLNPDRSEIQALLEPVPPLAWAVGPIEGVHEFALPDETRCLGFSPDGRLLATAGEDLVRVWDVFTGQQAYGFERGQQSSNFTCLRFSPDSQLLAVGSMSGAALWRVGSGELIQEFLIYRDHRPYKKDWWYSVDDIQFSPSGAVLAAFRRQHYSTHIWDLTAGMPLQEVSSVHPAMGPIHSLALSPDGRLLIEGGQRSPVLVWEVETGRLLHAFQEGQEEGAFNVAFSPDGKYLLVSGWDGITRVYDMTSASWLHDLAPQEDDFGFVSSMFVHGAHCACDTTLAVTWESRDITVWDFANATRLAQVKAKHSLGYDPCVALSPDGKLLALGGEGRPQVLAPDAYADVSRKIGGTREAE